MAFITAGRLASYVGRCYVHCTSIPNEEATRVVGSYAKVVNPPIQASDMGLRSVSLSREGRVASPAAVAVKEG